MKDGLLQGKNDVVLSDNRGYNPALPAVVPVFAEINALPCAEVQTSVRYWYVEAYARQRRLGVGRHVVVAFERVRIIWLVFGRKAVEYALHVGAHVRVGVLVDAQSAACVLHEEVEQALLGQRRQLAYYLFGHQMEPPASCHEPYFLLFNHVVYNGYLMQR